MEPGTSQYSLRWNNYQTHITYEFDSLRTDGDLVDVTLYCDGGKIKAHKILLSACSLYFKNIFKENPCKHPVVIFRNVKYEDLYNIVLFIYKGEVSVHQDALSSFLQTAELLSIQGLTNSVDKGSFENSTTIGLKPAAIALQPKPFPVFIATDPIAPISMATAASSTHHLSSEEVSIPTLLSNNKRDEPEKNDIQTHTEIVFRKDTSSSVTINTEDEEEEEEEETPLSFIPPTLKMEIPEFIDVETPRAGTQMDEEDNTDTAFTKTSQEFDFYDQEKYAEGEMDVSFQQTSNTSEQEQSDNPSFTQEEKTASTGGTAKPAGQMSPRGSLSFNCNICWKEFKHPNSLTMHKDLHTGKTKCPVCLRAFSRRHDMRKHLSAIHNYTIRWNAQLDFDTGSWKR